MATRKLPNTLTDDELRDLLREVNVRSKTGLRNKAALKSMAYGGLRVSDVLASDVAEAVDAVPDVEAEPEPETCEADEIAAQVLAALPAEVREALVKQLDR